MVEQQEDRGRDDDETIESLSPEEEQSLSEARQGLLRTMLTPVWWLFGIPVANWIVGYASIDPDSTFVFVIWSIFALMLPFAGTWAGVKQSRTIKEYDAQTGLWSARIAAIFGVIFGIVSLVMVVLIFTT
jgi:threonine/homoserine/homoserine lactone efflux protein